MQHTRQISLLLALGLAVCTPAGAASTTQTPPHLDARGRAAFEAYRQAADPRAFVIAPGGTWVWHADMATDQIALNAALKGCQGMTRQRCVPYALNDRIVFDAKSWPLSWGPYLTARQAGKAPVGVLPGQRFPNLTMTTPAGRPTRLSDLRGKVVVLHFWGSWCPPCQREMPDLQKLYASFKKTKDVAFVLLPVRESLADARRWTRSKRIGMPIYFGGESTVEKGEFPLADGGVMHDRQLAKAFPTTFVLDKHGVVVFSHVGPIDRWLEYAPFLKDVAGKSGK
ncbi:MAG: TlpA disulfide reductase family protein [Thiobacillus sp.]